MNTEASQEQIVSKTAGVRLRQARELLGLTRQVVAERLCLKVSTICDIEEDKAQLNLATTFLRGYIRSYARLVRLPEDELLSMLTNDLQVTPATKITPMQSLLPGKKHKKHDGWLMNFTWLIAIVVLGLTGAWWWQNYKAQREEIASMADNPTVQLSQSGEQSATLGSRNSAANGNPESSTSHENGDSVSGLSNTAVNIKNTAIIENGVPQSIDRNRRSDISGDVNVNGKTPLVSNTRISLTNKASLVGIGDASASAGAQQSLPAVSSGQSSLLTADNTPTGAVPIDTNPLIMDFTGDCWVEIKDATGKTLFQNLQKNGTKLDLNLAGKEPYKLVIGVPAVVKTQYKGKVVDLSNFIGSSQTARFTLPTPVNAIH